MGKLIFFDIDGTIALPGQAPSAATVDAIRAVRSRGHKVFLSTGRREADIPESVRLIGFDGGIYSAGGRAVVGQKEIMLRPMRDDLVQRIAEIMREWNLYFMLENASGTYIGTKNQTFPNILSQLICTMEKELHAESQEKMPAHDPVYKFVFLTSSKTQATQLSKKLEAEAKVVCFNSLFPDVPVVVGEISDWNINKGTALLHICRYLKADPEDCIAFGDSMNDAEILQAVGIGIAMGNADECIKKLADQVCERCDEDGIAKTLARMKLI